MKHAMLLAAALLLAAGPAAGQAVISPGMTAEQVRERFGAPATSRVSGEWTYWYYHNGCPVRCGSDDVVFFRDDRVVAAVLRTARRRFAGPAPDDALSREEGARTGVDQRPREGEPEERAVVGGVRVEQRGGLIAVPGADRARPQAREGRPGEPSTIIISAPDAAPARQMAAPPPSGQAREGLPGEPSTIIISTPDAPPPALDVNPPPVDQPLPATPPPGVEPAAAQDAAPAENVEAADTRGETSIDRKARRTRQDRANEPTATERARRNDRRGTP